MHGHGHGHGRDASIYFKFILSPIRNQACSPSIKVNDRMGVGVYVGGWRRRRI